MKKLLTLVGLPALVLVGCADLDPAVEPTNQLPPTISATAAVTTPQPTAIEVFPKTVDSCGKELEFKSAPEKVLMLDGAGFASLETLGLADRIALRVGDKYFGDTQTELQAKYDAIPVLEYSKLEIGVSDGLIPGFPKVENSSSSPTTIPTKEYLASEEAEPSESEKEQEADDATLLIEAIRNAGVDLVIGSPADLDLKLLNEAGVNLYTPVALCPDYKVDEANFDLVDVEVTNLAKIFGATDKASLIISENKQKLAALKPKHIIEGTTAAALYLSADQDETKLYAHGTASMAQPIFMVNKLKNSYFDVTEQQFEVDMADLLRRNPEWVVLLTDQLGSEKTLERFKALPQVSKLQAVDKNQIVVLPKVMFDPPSSLSVAGAVELASAIAEE